MLSLFLIMETKRCIECGEAFRGRADKKFCSDQCRNSFNNKLKGGRNNLVRNVNNLLSRNRRILEELVNTGSAKATKARLLEKGFNFGYHTNLFTNRKGSTYYFCYEYGYLALEEDQFLVVKWKEKPTNQNQLPTN